MARGDLFQITLAGDALQQDASWVVGALHTDLGVDVVSTGEIVSGAITAVIRLKNAQQNAPQVGKTVTAARAFSAPGMDVPSAKITTVEFLGNSFRPSATHEWWESPESRPIKVFGAVSLIVITAAFALRIKNP